MQLKESCGQRGDRIPVNSAAERLERRSAMFVNIDEVQAWSQGGGEQVLGLAQMPAAPPTTVAVIESIATGAPSRVVDQSEAADQVAELFSDSEQRERISRLYRKTMIGSRRMAVDPLD